MCPRKNHSCAASNHQTRHFFIRNIRSCFRPHERNFNPPPPHTDWCHPVFIHQRLQVVWIHSSTEEKIYFCRFLFINSWIQRKKRTVQQWTLKLKTLTDMQTWSQSQSSAVFAHQRRPALKLSRSWDLRQKVLHLWWSLRFGWCVSELDNVICIKSRMKKGTLTYTN